MEQEIGLRRESPLTVSQLTARIKVHLESGFAPIWMLGEISNLKRASSGHLYFSIKDEGAQIRATMWRSKVARLEIRPQDGMEVVAYGSLNVYAPRGEYSISVERLEERGQGRLRLAFERLKTKLQQEGLFDLEHKKTLPVLPRRIGVVTSPTGAAVRDVIRVIRQRYAGVRVLIYPARVQGEGSAAEIAAGIGYLDQRGDCDLLIVGRGGGSIEDLWAFNDEALARAIFAARTPVISAVGHEVDVTISDLVADVRAATPSQAAELAVKSYTEYHRMIEIQSVQLKRVLQHRVHQLGARLHRAEVLPAWRRVPRLVSDLQRRALDLDFRLEQSLAGWVHRRERRLSEASGRLRLDSVQQTFARLTDRTGRAAQGLDQGYVNTLEACVRRLELAGSRLHDRSPARVMDRGFSVVTNVGGRILRSPREVKLGEVVRVRMAQGELDARVVERERARQALLFEHEGGTS